MRRREHSWGGMLSDLQTIVTRVSTLIERETLHETDQRVGEISEGWTQGNSSIMRQHMKRNNNYIWKQTQVTKGDTVTNKKLTILAQDLCRQESIK